MSVHGLYGKFSLKGLTFRPLNRMSSIDSKSFQSQTSGEITFNANGKVNFIRHMTNLKRLTPDDK